MSPILSRAAISFSAEATSSACARLSSWHGPAMIEIGKSLPNLTGPISTISAAETAGLNGLGPVRARPCRAPASRSTQFWCFEYQGCAKGLFRRNDKPLAVTPNGKPVLPMQGLRSRQIGNGEAHGAERHPLAA